jgi:hypothetical protein
MPQRGTDPLPGHFDQTQLGYRQSLGAGAITTEMGPQLLEDLVPVHFGFHIDEVAHDDAADVAQANLARNFPCGLDVGTQDRFLGVLLPSVPPGVDIDADQRLGRLDHQRPASGKLDPRLEQIANFRLNVEFVEERGRLGK